MHYGYRFGQNGQRGLIERYGPNPTERRPIGTAAQLFAELQALLTNQTYPTAVNQNLADQLENALGTALEANEGAFNARVGSTTPLDVVIWLANLRQEHALPLRPITILRGLPGQDHRGGRTLTPNEVALELTEGIARGFWKEDELVGLSLGADPMPIFVQRGRGAAPPAPTTGLRGLR